MKNILIFVSQMRAFPDESQTLIKIQIDNSLDLGWRREDIILAVNFDFEYNGIKSTVVSDDNYVEYCKTNSKFKCILELFERRYITKGELYWFHDLDVFQGEVITESEIALGEADMALTDYGWRDKWNAGSIFFTFNAKDIFEAIVKTQDLLMIQDERALMLLTNKFSEKEYETLAHSYDEEILKQIPKIKNIEKRIKKINTSYNFTPVVDTKRCFDKAIKPIKAFHCLPSRSFPKLGIPRLLDFYMYGKNDMNLVLMPERLIKIYSRHGIK